MLVPERPVVAMMRSNSSDRRCPRGSRLVDQDQVLSHLGLVSVMVGRPWARHQLDREAPATLASTPCGAIFRRAAGLKPGTSKS